MSTDDDIRTTIQLLEVRLQRLEFVLTGNTSGETKSLSRQVSETHNGEQTDQTVIARLKALQTGLDKLRRQNGPGGALVREVEALHSKVPELSSAHPSNTMEDLSMQASLVLAHASLYPETASRLSSLQTLQVPSAELSSQLTDLREKVESFKKNQQEADEEVQELRQRSARCLEWWVNVGVFGVGDVWEEWEQRIVEIQRQVTRCERRQREEEGYL